MLLPYTTLNYAGVGLIDGSGNLCFSVCLQDFAFATVSHSVKFFSLMYHGHQVQTILYFEDRHMKSKELLLKS